MKAKKRVSIFMCFILTLTFVLNSTIVAYAEPPQSAPLENTEFTITEVTDENLLKMIDEGQVIETRVIDKNTTLTIISIDNELQSNTTALGPGTKFDLILGATILLRIVHNGTTRVFQVSAHAVTRIAERFAGSYEKVVDILVRRGDVYVDIEHGGYAFYDSASRCAVVLDKGLTVIKTVMDNVSIWDKFTSGKWTIPLEQIPNLFP